VTADAPQFSGSPPRVALFVTCLVDVYRPAVGFAAVSLLENAGCEVHVPAQTCCGQPNFNSGDSGGAAQMARRVIESFAEFDYVVVPSGSCAAMISRHYPSLFPDDSGMRSGAEELAGKTYELTAFLHDVVGVNQVTAKMTATVTYHDACSGLRELGIKDQPRRLLRSIEGLELREMKEADACCGFGGMFCIKYPEISNRIVDTKARDIVATGADIIVSGDTGCLLQIQGKLHRDGSRVKAAHVAEMLAGQFEEDSVDEVAPRAND
jgi:L-lactate dehydrogenase complex protein LldE